MKATTRIMRFGFAMLAAALLLACSSPTSGSDDDPPADDSGGSEYDLVSLAVTAGTGSATGAVTLSPTFAPATRTYTATVGKDVDTLAVALGFPEVESPEFWSVYTAVNDTSFDYETETAALDYGVNTLLISYSYGDSASIEYTISITRATTAWSTRAAISDMSSFPYDHAMDSNGNLAVAYQSTDTGSPIKIATYSYATDTWSEIYSEPPADYFNSVALAYDSSNNLIAVTVTQEGTGLSANYYPTVKRYSSGSWSTLNYSGLQTASTSVLLFGTDEMDVALDADDNIYVASEASYSENIDNKVFVLKYDSGTSLWEPLGWVPENSNIGNESIGNVEMVVAAENEVYVGIELSAAVSPASVVTVFGYDGSQTWSQVGNPLTTYGVGRITGAVNPATSAVTYFTGNGSPNYRLSELVSGSWAGSEFTYESAGDEIATFAFDGSGNAYVPYMDGYTTDVSFKKFDGTSWTAPFSPIAAPAGICPTVYAAVHGTTLYAFGMDHLNVFWMRTTTIE